MQTGRGLQTIYQAYAGEGLAYSDTQPALSWRTRTACKKAEALRLTAGVLMADEWLPPRIQAELSVPQLSGL